jgi:catechol 2,3-dioxygenase-like lactoylglutathione lyase family enzyme
MQQRMDLVTLGVADLARSRAFYSDGLGWMPTFELDEIVFYQVGFGTLLAVFPLAELGADAGHAATPGTPFSLAQVVDDTGAVDAAVARARTAGATVLKEPQWASFGGYHAYFADPDGHRWEVAYNPGWTVADDGTVTLVPIGDIDRSGGAGA